MHRKLIPPKLQFMSKLIIILAVAIAAVWYFRHYRLPAQQPRSGRAAQAGTETTMVRCEQCQVYLPPANAIQRAGRWYCQQHR